MVLEAGLRGMLRLIIRLPAHLHERVIKGALLAALITAFFSITCFGAFSESTETSGALWWKKTSEIPMSERVPWLIGGLILVIVAIILVVIAVKLFLIQVSARRYTAILTGVESIELREVAHITRTSAARVSEDLEALIDSGVLEDYYVDHGSQRVVSRKFVPKAGRKAVVECQGCGAQNDVIVGITRPCDFCRQPVSFETT